MVPFPTTWRIPTDLGRAGAIVGFRVNLLDLTGSLVLAAKYKTIATTFAFGSHAQRFTIRLIASIRARRPRTTSANLTFSRRKLCFTCQTN